MKQNVAVKDTENLEKKYMEEIPVPFPYVPKQNP
jgi:hypothetical protein